MRWYYFKALGGETIVTTSLIGNEINELFRDGRYYRKVLGTPVGNQFYYDVSNGNFSFDESYPPLAPDETIDIGYKYENISEEPVVTKIGAQIFSDTLTTQEKAEVAISLGITYIRSGITLSTWTGHSAQYETYEANGLKNVVNLNWAQQTGTPPFPTDMVEYAAKLNSVLGIYTPELIIIENEEINSSFHEDPETNISKYITMLATAAPIVHGKGLKMANGGIYGAALDVLTVRYLRDRYNDTIATDHANSTLTPGQVTAAFNPGTNPTLEAQITMIQTILDEGKAYVDYFNIHPYEDLNPNDDETEQSNLTTVTLNVIRYTKEFIEVTTGKQVITNETGQRTNEQPDLVEAMLTNYTNLHFAYVLWFSGDSDLADARALQNSDGSLRPNGEAFRDFILQYQQ